MYCLSVRRFVRFFFFFFFCEPSRTKDRGCGCLYPYKKELVGPRPRLRRVYFIRQFKRSRDWLAFFFFFRPLYRLCFETGTHPSTLIDISGAKTRWLEGRGNLYLVVLAQRKKTDMPAGACSLIWFFFVVLMLCDVGCSWRRNKTHKIFSHQLRLLEEVSRIALIFQRRKMN